MNNPLGNFSQRQPAIGPQGLERLCQAMNTSRAELGIPQRYRIVRKNNVETLEIFRPERDPVPFDELGNKPKSSDYRLTQEQVDELVAERGRGMSIARDRGLIHKRPDGRFVPA